MTSNNTDEPTADQQLIEKAREFSLGKNWVTAQYAGQGELTWGFVWAAMAEFANRQNADLEARLSLAVEALEHYADEWHWTGCGEGDESLTAGYYEDVWCCREPGNGYDIAAQALANIKGEGGEDD